MHGAAQHVAANDARERGVFRTRCTFLSRSKLVVAAWRAGELGRWTDAMMSIWLVVALSLVFLGGSRESPKPSYTYYYSSCRARRL